MSERKYLPTFSDLVDRLSIVLMKAIFISEHREEYLKERDEIEHDIDLLLDKRTIVALDIRAILMIMLANRFIWQNEADARQGGDGQLDRLRMTHSVNGCRNIAKNVLSSQQGERVDLRIDCLAADLEKQFGNWKMF